MKGPKLENQRGADQLDHAALRLIAARPDVFARQGHVAAGYRRRNGELFGPYYRLSYREGGRQQSVYLGRCERLVQRVRETLAALQRPRIERRAVNRLQRSLRVSLRIEKVRLGALLRRYGLHLKGMEVRGWRFSSFHSLLPRLPRLVRRTSPRRPARRPKETPAARLLRFLKAREGYLPSRCMDVEGLLGPLR